MTAVIGIDATAVLYQIPSLDVTSLLNVSVKIITQKSGLNYQLIVTALPSLCQWYLLMAHLYSTRGMQSKSTCHESRR